MAQVISGIAGEANFKSFQALLANFTPIYRVLTYWVPGLYWQRQMALGKVVPAMIKKYGGLGPHIMQARIDEITKAIRPERLLIFRLQERWEPLCKFLDLPVPDVPFPRTNDAASLGVFIKDQH